MSAPIIETVPVTLERKFIIQRDVELDTLWQTNRNGRSGNGLLVEMPSTRVRSPNVRGAPENITLGIVCFQNGDAALTPETGGGFQAEILSQVIKDLLHLQVIGGIGTLLAEASEPAREYDFINAWRRTFLITSTEAQQTERCASPIVSIADGEATLTCATAAAAIYYTLDGSTPHDPALTETISGQLLNPQAQTYAAPFAVASGQTLRAIAMKFQFNPSEIIRQLIP